MKVSLEQWRMLKAVIDHGGFAHASDAVFKSQSSINTAVHKLQDALGVQLIKVVGRKAELTVQGELLLRRAKQLLADADKIEQLAASFNQGVEAQLRIAVDMAYPQDKLFKALALLSKQFPQTNVELFETVLGGSNEMLKRDQVDLAIATHADECLQSKALLSINFICVAAPTHPLFAYDQVTFNDLKRYRQIVIRDSSIKREYEAGWLGADQRWTVDNMLTSLNLLKKGLGYANLPQHLIATELMQGNLKALTIQNSKESRGDLLLVCKDYDLLGPAAQALHQHILTIK